MRQEGTFTFPSNHSLPTYDSFESGSPQLSNSPYQDTDSISDQSKKIRKRRSTYKKIDDGTRAKLLEAVHQGETLKAAAKRYDINYSSAKSILHTFRKEGRIFKKSAQERNSRKRTKSSNDLEMSPIYLTKPCQEEFNSFAQGSSFQNYFANCKFETSSKYASTDEESPKVRNNAMTINTFGDFLKIDSQGRQKSETLGLNSQTSTLVLKLESQRFHSTPITKTQGIQSGNWLLNVNVHSQTQNKGQTQLPGNHTLAKQQDQKVLEPIRINYTNASLFTPEHPKTEPVSYVNSIPPKEPQSYSNGVDTMNFLNDEHHYEPSTFFDPSPAYAFQPQEDGRLFGHLNSMASYTNYKPYLPGTQEVFYEERR